MFGSAPIKSILLADDDADDCDLFQEAVSLINPMMVLKTIRDGEELLDYLTSHTQLPDLLFLDLNMPKKNGMECIQEIRRNDNLQQLPILIYSTTFNKKNIDETFRYGALGFMRKPNSFNELTETLKNIVTLNEKAKEKLIINQQYINNVQWMK